MLVFWNLMPVSCHFILGGPTNFDPYLRRYWLYTDHVVAAHQTHYYVVVDRLQTEPVWGSGPFTTTNPVVMGRPWQVSTLSQCGGSGPFTTTNPLVMNRPWQVSTLSQCGGSGPFTTSYEPLLFHCMCGSR